MATYFFCNIITARIQSSQLPKINIKFLREDIGPPTKNSSRYYPSPGTGKATDFKFGQYIHRVHPNKSPLKILEKRERERIQGSP